VIFVGSLGGVGKLDWSSGMSVNGKSGAAVSQARLLCCTGVPSTLVIPDLLRGLHDIVPAAGYVFTWFDSDGVLAGMYCEPPLDTPAPLFLSDPSHMLELAHYRGDHLLPGTQASHLANFSQTEEFKRSEFYDLMCRPAGVDHGWDGFVRVGPHVRGVLALWRDAQMPAVTAEDDSRLRAVFPYLAHLLESESFAEWGGRSCAC